MIRLVGRGVTLVVDEEGDLVMWVRHDGARGVDYEHEPMVLWLLPDGETETGETTDAMFDLLDVVVRVFGTGELQVETGTPCRAA